MPNASPAPSPEPRSSSDRSDAARLLAARQAVEQARQALGRGERLTARRLAARAAALAPDLEDPWLVLAVVAAPRASIAYLKRALTINPSSRRARAGMHWAVGRLRQAAPGRAGLPGTQMVRTRGLVPTLARAWPAAAPVTALPRRIRARDFGFVLAVMLLALATLLAYRAWEPVAGPAFERADRFAVGLLFTATPTATATATATATPTETPTATPTATDTPVPSATPSPTATFTETPTPLPTLAPTDTPLPPPPQPTKRPKPKKVAGPEGAPGALGPDERWIDVDLSSQTTYAMQGNQVVNSFVVSTGLWPNLTVTGVYRIYVKYRSADMYGADYYLSGVPYVMYFYKGYGLHGTYWHNNFGSPMSHGCVNLRPTDAGWLFDFAEVGTIVSVHE